MQSVRWQPLSGLLINAHYWFQHSDRALPRLNTYEGNDNANKSRQKENTHRAVANIQWTKNRSKLLFSSDLNIEKMIFSMQNQVYGSSVYPVYYSVSSVWSYSNKIQYQFEAGKNTLFKAGYTFAFHHVISKDTVQRTGYNQYRRNNKLFVSWQQKWAQLFSMQFFLQKEWVNQDVLPWVPYLGFEMKMPFDQHLVLFGNTSREVHYPTLNDLYWQPGGNPDLLPEEGWVSSAGLRYATKWKKFRWSGKITWFYNDIKNWIIWLPGLNMSATNIRHVLSRGLEVNLKTAFPVRKLWVLLRADYAFNMSTNLGDAARWGGGAVGKQLPYTPVHSGNFTADVRWKQFSITWVNHFYSERYATYASNLTSRDRLYPYSLNDLYLGKKWKWPKNSLSAQLKIYNLFNKQYWSVLQRPMPGINYMLLLNYQF
jgi:iron complex outermembrane receptor protein